MRVTKLSLWVLLFSTVLYFETHTCTVHCQINPAYLFLTMQTLDGDFFDQLRGYFTTLGQVEVDACKNAMLGFETVVSQANTVSWIVISDVANMNFSSSSSEASMLTFYSSLSRYNPTSDHSNYAKKWFLRSLP